MSKYRPLSDRLSRHAGDEWRATFEEIEAILAAPLPKAAQQAGWWAGAVEKPHHRAWLDHGWRAAEVDKAAGAVIFRRERAAPAPVVEAPSEAAAEQDQAKPTLGATALIGGAVALIAGLGVFAVKMLKGRRA